MERFHSQMHCVAEGIPELIEAPAPRKTSNGWSRDIPIERTMASIYSTCINWSSPCKYVFLASRIADTLPLVTDDCQPK